MIEIQAEIGIAIGIIFGVRAEIPAKSDKDLAEYLKTLHDVGNKLVELRLRMREKVGLPN